MVPPMAELREIATGLHFPEGPVAMSDGSVIVVEIGAGTVTRVAADGSKEEVARPGGGPNGAAIGPDGNLYVCNNGAAFDYLELPGMEGILVPRQPPSNYSSGRIERIDMGSGAVEVIYEECDGRPLRAPNDLVFDGHGGFYFTDHGLREQRRPIGRACSTRSRTARRSARWCRRSTRPTGSVSHRTGRGCTSPRPTPPPSGTGR